ncbi:hypothetical protein IFM89_022194 [Coptis chinensis]|uniref:F-box domain-containing protein n=1 Tax=Coptis chinensis TaxID=261450 RepID=A0A835HS92_9MAGN|nr:hypothetical protein IFM89_022194 [Coptis chinensis]
MDTLPIDITTGILSSLPVKSILQSRCVCKTWRSVIDSSHFADIHLARTVQGKTTSNLIFLRHRNSDFYILEGYKESSQCIINARNKIDLLCQFNEFAFVGSLHGLVCISYTRFPAWRDHDSIVHIYNPSTRDSVTLPEFKPPECEYAKLVAGFGLDCVTKKYKVVQVFCPVDRRKYVKQEVQVYTFGSNSWRKIGYAPDVKFDTSWKRTSAFVNGSCHWLSVDEPKNGVASVVIVSFDLAREEFGYIPIEDWTNNDSYSTEIWIMKDYNVKESWTKFVVMKINYMGKFKFRMGYPISFLKNGDILLHCDARRLVSYNIERRKHTTLKVNGLPVICRKRNFPALGILSWYAESLIPLKSA